MSTNAQDPVLLDEIIISGGITPIEQARYGRAYSVLTAEQIRQRGITSVQDALRAVPGVAVNGSGRSFTKVRIRGGEGNHALVLIDGVEAAGGGDEYGISGLSALDIERIEVLRGPQSVYYGSNASSGVINIITKKASGTGYGGQVEFGNGHIANVYAQTRTDRGGLRLSFGDSYDKGVDESGRGGERDFIDRQTLRLNGDWQASEALSFRTIITAAREKHAYDRQDDTATGAAQSVVDDPSLFTWKREQILSFGAVYEMMGGRLVHDLSLARTISRSRSDESDPWTKGTTDSLKYRAQYGVDGAVDSADHIVNFLAERQEDYNRSDTAYYRREMNSYALEYRGELPRGISLQAGLRYDDNKVFDDFLGFTLAAAWQVNDGVRLHGSIGRASVNPGYYELFADDGFTVGNPGLKPEQNRSVDLGVELTSADGRGQVDVTAFHEVLRDEISYLYGAAPDGSGRASYVNQPGKSRRKGLEVSGGWDLTDQLRLGLNYTHLRATNPDDSVEVRRPRHELGLQATWQTADEGFAVTGDLRHVAGNRDTQYVGSYPVAKLPDYTVFNLSARYAVTDQAILTGRVLNVFDKEYSDVWGYRAQDRAVWLGLSADF
ncbi:TonB-dependent receptor plug domain-containing protein [Paracoccus luteus]|uniref:TonB-dependent receptor plug domain-containing protein n=1 Tax=Paracoccus luteus TaxID=2508543 RepID=UPI001FE3347A|nr:TonB-dependent receptor [Paracoccus luteus]